MNGRQLKFLAEVADLARLDFEAASITLKRVFDPKLGWRVVSRYRGAYSSGQRWDDLPDVPDLDIAVSAMQFKSLVSLFGDEEEIKLIPSAGSLLLKSSDKEINLNTRGDTEDLEPLELEGVEYVEAPVVSILREVECASEFSARSMAKPVLTGLRIAGGNGKLGVQSSDGVSTLFETTINVEGNAQLDMIAPGYDLVLGLRLLDTGMAKLARTQQPNHVILYGEKAMFRSSILQGTWPDFSRVRAPQHRQSAEIPSSLIRSLVQSVRILGSSNDLRLRGDGENLYLETMEAEAGHFEAKMPAKIEGSYTFDVGSFLLAQAIGAQLVIQLPNEGGVPTLVESGERRFWIASRLG